MRRREYGYDEADRLTTETWFSPANVQLQQQSFGYDASSNLTSANDPDGNYSISYDKLNRAEVVNGPFGFNQTFGYDEVGNRTSVTDNRNGTLTSTFDLANQLTSRMLNDGSSKTRIDYTWTKRGELDTVSRWTGPSWMLLAGTSDYTYDDAGRLTGLVHTNGASTPVATYGYGYDLGDRMTSKTENGVTTTFGYDLVGQLTTVNGAGLYSYDAAGNRNMAGYTTTADNRMTAGNGWNYAYDKLGNVTSKSNGSQSWTYEYDLAAC